jgi:ERCC4-type nuclease
VLPVVLERKTWADLDGSIKDGRFESQKQKMLRCGLPLKVYLVEGDHVTCGWSPNRGAPGGQVAYAADLRTRLDELACLSGFHVVLTHNHHKTIVILSAPPAQTCDIHPQR